MSGEPPDSRRGIARRTFLTHAASVGIGIGLGSLAPGRLGLDAIAGDVTLPDFSRSFVINTAPFNAVRFWIESRTTVFDGEREVTTLYQCGAMKAEDTFADRDLFYAENYDFMPIFSSGGEVLILRRHAEVDRRYREVKRVADAWGEPAIHLVTAGYRAVDGWSEIRDATERGEVLVTRTEVARRGGLRAVIDCPTKTMNVSHERHRYQVDVGPVALPDLDGPAADLLDRVSLAFLAFSGPDRVSFITERPVEVGDTATYHYTEPFDLPAANQVFARG